MGGKRMAGAAVVDDDRIVWASGLPTGTSAQRAELVALTQALRMAEAEGLEKKKDIEQRFFEKLLISHQRLELLIETAHSQHVNSSCHKGNIIKKKSKPQ
ncbi:hypothetical protein MUG91_G22n2 [Manis pentadactyla]|nr:hypothetical protein MUG91_G22n2 [Manis pentadactyla]